MQKKDKACNIYGAVVGGTYVFGPFPFWESPSGKGMGIKMISLEQELKSNSYPGRGIVIGESANGKYAVTAYFIMGRSVNSRNRIFVTDGEGIRTEAFDPSKLEDPSLII